MFSKLTNWCMGRCCVSCWTSFLFYVLCHDVMNVHELLGMINPNQMQTVPHPWICLLLLQNVCKLHRTISCISSRYVHILGKTIPSGLCIEKNFLLVDRIFFIATRAPLNVLVTPLMHWDILTISILICFWCLAEFPKLVRKVWNWGLQSQMSLQVLKRTTLYNWALFQWKGMHLQLGITFFRLTGLRIHSKVTSVSNAYCWSDAVNAIIIHCIAVFSCFLLQKSPPIMSVFSLRIITVRKLQLELLLNALRECHLLPMPQRNLESAAVCYSKSFSPVMMKMMCFHTLRLIKPLVPCLVISIPFAGLYIGAHPRGTSSPLFQRFHNLPSQSTDLSLVSEEHSGLNARISLLLGLTQTPG